MPVKNARVIHKKQFAVYGIIFSVLIIQLMKIGNLPGLYFDAIVPDYIAVQLLYPQEHQTMWQAAWPWLAQVYHGNTGILITMLSILITGHTSILQHHIVYGMIAGLSLCFLFKILTHKRIGLSTLWAGTTVILLCVWPSLINSIITQYFIELFGTLCILSGFYLYLNWMEEKSQQWLIYASFFLFGLAFYSYFNFAFFLPSLFVLTWLHTRKKQKANFDRLLLYLFACIAGCGFYCIGYIQIAFKVHGVALDGLGRLLVLLVFYALLLLLFMAFLKKAKFRYWVLGSIGLAAAIGVWKAIPSLGSYIDTLHVFGSTPSGLWDTIRKMISDFNSILSGRIAEYMIYGYSVTVYNTKILFLTIILLIITFILEMSAKRYSMKWKTASGIIIIYLVCGLAFGNRMTPQHYVPLLFACFALVSLAASSCVKSINTLITHRLLTKYLRIAGIAMLCSLFFLGIFNQSRIINEVRTTRGYGKYSAQLTELAKTAMQNAENGNTELYVFHDWGFFAGFSHLTMNHVPYITALDIDTATAFYQNGGNVVACFWNSEDREQYVAFMQEVAGESGNIVLSSRNDTNGSAAFYEIRIIH